MKIKDLTPNAKNPRTITDKKKSMLKKALLEFGDLSGIVFNRKTKQLVGGRQRRDVFDSDSVITYTKKYSKGTKTGTVAEGFIELKGERFSYREVFWPELREKAANIAANKSAGEWDIPQLSEWIKELNDFDLDFDLELTMFDENELKQFDVTTVKEHTRKAASDKKGSEEKPPRTKLGDIYQLGEHRLMCGDAENERHVSKLLNGEKLDVVFDQPHGINFKMDFFGVGDGTVLLGCKKSPLTCFVMELDPKNCDTITARWEKHTGETAKLLTPHPEIKLKKAAKQPTSSHA